MSANPIIYNSTLQQIINNMESCILGKSEEIRLILTALLAGGHILLEDVPGTGKTVMIKSLAKSIHGHFRRIQCNPDLLPSDITGVSIYHPKTEEFIFRPGPVMTNILLIDEINRATTKTQSALLEAMEEHQVTVDGIEHPLPDPFLLLATQNPIDFESTYALPEAQLDRFLLKLSLGYPDYATESRMVLSQMSGHPLERIQPVAGIAEIIELQSQVHQIHVDRGVAEYGIAVARKTRENKSIFLGASPRATLALVHASRAYALLNGRDFVLPDDIKYMAPYVLGHRLILTADARMSGATPEQLLQGIFEDVQPPIRLER